MSTIDLKERLIEKIQEIDNDDILAEAYRLLGLEFEGEEPFKLSLDQKNAVAEARAQIKTGAYLTDQEADKEIDEWLKE
jgi:ABC-type lipoprotein export system ATPase subunit